MPVDFQQLDAENDSRVRIRYFRWCCERSSTSQWTLQQVFCKCTDEFHKYFTSFILYLHERFYLIEQKMQTKETFFSLLQQARRNFLVSRLKPCQPSDITDTKGDTDGSRSGAASKADSETRQLRESDVIKVTGGESCGWPSLNWFKIADRKHCPKALKSM